MSDPSKRRKRSGPRGDLCAAIRICTVQVACDGRNLANDRELCGPCERTLKRRQKRTDALRGERCISYAISRRKA